MSDFDRIKQEVIRIHNMHPDTEGSVSAIMCHGMKLPGFDTASYGRLFPTLVSAHESLQKENERLRDELGNAPAEFPARSLLCHFSTERGV